LSQAVVYDVLLVSALLLANLPFLSERFFGFVRLKSLRKSLRFRFVEYFLAYLLLLFVALFVEAQQGQVFTQTWTFYGLTVLGFLILAFPGLVYCFFWKRSLLGQEKKHRQ
jgi:hypothetical protein